MKKRITVLLLLCLMMGCLTGCQKKAETFAENNGLADELAAVEVQSNEIKASLEKDALTQAEMNRKSGELCDLWEKAMNRILEKAKNTLPAAELEKLTADQSAWMESRTQAAESAGKNVEGGSLYTLVINMETAKLTEARVYELYALLK